MLQRTLINLKNTLGVICLVWLVASCRPSKEPSATLDQAVKVKSIFEIQNNELAKKIIRQSYNWKFKKADKLLSKLREDKEQLLLADLLDVGNGFWRYIAATTPEKNIIAKREYARAVSSVKLNAAKALKKDSSDLKALFLLGFTEGSQAKFYAIEAEWFKAYRYGVRGYNRLLKIQRINKDDYDSQFGIGVYKYYCATFLPKWFQKISWMVPGIDVDRKGGYERMVKASHYASVIKIEAQLALSQSDAQYERKYVRSKKLLSHLIGEFPQNHVVRYSLAAACYYYGVHLRYAGKSKDSQKELKKGLSISLGKPGFRMVLRKRSYLMPGMKWTLVAHSDMDLVFHTHLEISRNYFYMNQLGKSAEALLDGIKSKHMPKMLKAALYFEMGHQQRVLGLKGYKIFIDEAAKEAGIHSVIAKHCRDYLSSKYHLPALEKVMYQLNADLISGKSDLKQVLSLYSKYKNTSYRYQFYRILSHLYQINQQPKRSEKYDDLYRVSRQAER